MLLLGIGLRTRIAVEVFFGVWTMSGTKRRGNELKKENKTS